MPPRQAFALALATVLAVSSVALQACSIRDVDLKRAGAGGGAGGEPVDEDDSGVTTSTTSSTHDAGAAGAGGLWNGRDDAGTGGTS